MFIIQKHRPATALTGFSPFLHLCIFLLLILLPYAPTAAADTNLYSNEPEVPVRSGQGTEYKIISLLKNGEAVVPLEEDIYWTRVRTATGREGWVLKRYLSSIPSIDIDDAFSLPTNNNETREQTEKISPMTEQPTNALQPEPNATPETLQSPQTEESINPPQFKEQPIGQDKELKELRNKLAEVTMENEVLRKDERIKWFLAGGGVLLIGWIIGLITCKSGRRKPSLL